MAPKRLSNRSCVHDFCLLEANLRFIAPKRFPKRFPNQILTRESFCWGLIKMELTFQNAFQIKVSRMKLVARGSYVVNYGSKKGFQKKDSCMICLFCRPRYREVWLQKGFQIKDSCMICCCQRLIYRELWTPKRLPNEVCMF